MNDSGCIECKIDAAFDDATGRQTEDTTLAESDVKRRGDALGRRIGLVGGIIE